MSQEPKQLPVPSLTPEQVQSLINYANEKLPTMYGNDILKFIKDVAIEIEKQSEENKASV